MVEDRSKYRQKQRQKYMRIARQLRTLDLCVPMFIDYNAKQRSASWRNENLGEKKLFFEVNER